MSKLLTRRTLVTAGLTTAAGASGIGAAVYFADRYGLIPPDHGGIWGIGETLTYASQRLLTSGQSLAREFARSDISSTAPVNGPAPQDETYRGLLADGFKDWRLQIEGLVERPISFSLDELKSLPRKAIYCCTPARKVGPTLPNGPASGCPAFWTSSKPARRRDMSGSFRSRTRIKIPESCAYCGTALIWPTPFIRRRCSPMA